MNIFLEIYLISGALVGFFEGLFLEHTAKKLFKSKGMQNMDYAILSVTSSIIFIAITPIFNTLHIFNKIFNLFIKTKSK